MRLNSEFEELSNLFIRLRNSSSQSVLNEFGQTEQLKQHLRRENP